MVTETVSAMQQYLSFNLEDEVFALDISKVREVIEFTTVTKVPQTPEFMRGVINLRGNVVPVIDMKFKFGIGRTEKDVNTCVIISDVNVDAETVVLGIMADAVDEVFDLGPDSIEPAPRIGTMLDTEFLKGMGKKDDEFLLLLDIDRVFTFKEIEMVKASGEYHKARKAEQEAKKEEESA